MEPSSIFIFKRVENKKDSSTVYRTNFMSESDALKWLDEYSKKTNTNWIVRNGVYNPQRLVFHKHFVCQHSVRNKTGQDSKRNSGCISSIDIKIKKCNKATRKNDVFLKGDSPFPGIVKMNITHNHAVDTCESLKFLRMDDEIKKQYIRYFEDGLGVSESIKQHQNITLLNNVPNLPEVTANARINPTYNMVKQLFNKWRKGGFGGVMDNVAKINDNILYVKQGSSTMEDLLVPEVCLSISETSTILCNDGANKENSNEVINVTDTVWNDDDANKENSNEVINVSDSSKSENSDEIAAPKIPIDCFKELENIISATIPEEYSLEELAHYQELFREAQPGIQFYRVHCTACQEHLGTAPVNQNKRYIHPLLKVILCKHCYDFYCSGEFEKDEDGSELYCRWCGEGGNVLCCAACPYVFCKKCIWKNLGRKKLEEVKESDDWLCFVCVPSQMISLRVMTRALYEYTLSEIKCAKLANDPERLRKDEGICCQRKPKPVPAKRKRTSSNDLPYDPYLDNTGFEVKRKVRQPVFIKPKPETESSNKGEVFLNTQVEDEVVCTPDVFLFMEDEECETTTANAPSVPVKQPPPLIPAPRIMPILDDVTITKKANTYQLPKPQQQMLPDVTLIQPRTGTTSPETKNKVVKPMIKFSNTTLGNGHSVVTVTHNLKKTKQTTQLLPGLKHEWFERATQLSKRVNYTLSSRLESLAVEQNTALTLEELANVHNKLQEVLSNSINSLIQVRKNLRSEFLDGLTKLKFSTTITPSTSLSEDDDDVICVDDNEKQQKQPLNNQPPPVTENKPRAGAFIKVRPLATLINPEAPIEIIDDIEKTVLSTMDKAKTAEDTRKITEVATNETKDKNEENESNKKEPNKEESNKEEPKKEEHNKASPNNEIVQQKDELKDVDENLNPEVLKQIQDAIEQSKLEKMLHDTVRADIPTEELKRFLSVKVILKRLPLEMLMAKRAQILAKKENKVKRIIEQKPIEDEMQDIEQLLETNVVAKAPAKFSPENHPAEETNEIEEEEDSTEDEDPDWYDKIETREKMKGEENSNDPQTVDSGIDVECDRVHTISRTEEKDEEDDDKEDNAMSSSTSKDNDFRMRFASQVECDA
ncbi:uncharacterized protein LOC108736369 isoform X2 [Agrilus planipennis]|uniref:Uncharacterized protein LOC108736369 isoform X2 n=1 Tax=Agrilus planipennis TaxID=224129 RepID=A0A1W4WK17_AGRPL|nr:uncharacterized protein LOC108736369 isoform X2 [Agrilus planipennis]